MDPDSGIWQLFELWGGGRQEEEEEEEEEGGRRRNVNLNPPKLKFGAGSVSMRRNKGHYANEPSV